MNFTELKRKESHSVWCARNGQATRGSFIAKDYWVFAQDLPACLDKVKCSRRKVQFRVLSHFWSSNKWPTHYQAHTTPLGTVWWVFLLYTYYYYFLKHTKDWFINTSSLIDSKFQFCCCQNVYIIPPWTNSQPSPQGLFYLGKTSKYCL